VPMNKIYLLLLFLVGVINFLPIIGILSLEKINQAYGLSVTDNNLEVLLRHRALLFGLVGGFIIYSVFNPQYQTAAIVLAAISMFGYLYFSWSIGGVNHALVKIAQIDIIGIVLLITAVVLRYFLNDS
jgi:hypothetical protein